MQVYLYFEGRDLKIANKEASRTYTIGFRFWSKGEKIILFVLNDVDIMNVLFHAYYALFLISNSVSTRFVTK